MTVLRIIVGTAELRRDRSCFPRVYRNEMLDAAKVEAVRADGDGRGQFTAPSQRH